MSEPVKVKEEKGSKKWLQILVNDRPDLFNAMLRDAIKLPEDTTITWLSPLKSKNHVEYRDGKFLETLNVVPPLVTLNEFWPSGGPRWDALGKTGQDDLLLVEAKAHIPEMVTTKSGATAANSIEKIQAALRQTKQEMAPNLDVDWSTNFYQYANRLAHLYWFRELNNLPAYMIFVYFIGDHEMKGPKTREEWEGAIKLVETFMGIRENKLSKYVVKLFVDVRDLSIGPHTSTQKSVCLLC